MKKLVFILLLVLLSSRVWTQENYSHQYSSAPENARYQIVQSEMAPRITLLVDKQTGRTHLLVEGRNGLEWELMEIEKQTLDNSKLGEVNYQVFTSGNGVRFTFLINVKTGATWQLTEDSDFGTLFWTLME